jgi:two-component system, sensor histidine kinase and response regulator
MKTQSTVLIVDDDLNNLQVLGNILRNNNYNVEVATRGLMALDQISEVLPDIILLDIMMPEMDGYETCTKIKQMPECKNVPIIFISALSETDEIIKGLNCGAVDFLIKPYNPPIILTKVNLHLELKNKTVELEDLNKSLEEKVRERTNELEKANFELQQLDKAKSEFLGIISHEIRTPLNGIIGFSSLLKNEVLSKKTELYLKNLDESVHRLERFSLKALLYTQLSAERYRLKLVNVSFDKVFVSLFEKFKERIQSKKLTLNISNPDNSIIQADYPLIVECLENILENAIYYSPEKSVITFEAQQQEDKTVFRVIDQGEGFTEKALKTLFKVFTNGNESFVNGEGIDLAICALIMKLHKGEILVNNLDQGAMVELIFYN